MLKYYPSVTLSLTDAETICRQSITFKDGYPTKPSIYVTLEDYIGQPIISIQPSGRNTDELVIILAYGIVTRSLLNKTRVCRIAGTFETIITTLQDIFQEHPNVSPKDIFCRYTYECTAAEQVSLNDWAKTL